MERWKRYTIELIALIVIYIGLIVLICNVRVPNYVYIPLSVIIGMRGHYCFDQIRIR